MSACAPMPDEFLDTLGIRATEVRAPASASKTRTRVVVRSLRHPGQTVRTSSASDWARRFPRDGSGLAPDVEIPDRR